MTSRVKPVRFRRKRPCLAFSALFAALTASPPGLQADNAYPGVPSRDQNPLFQGYLIPSVTLQSSNGWRTSHSLYITNTYQRDQSRHEQLVIDVENIHYDLSAAYSLEEWNLGATLSLIDNSGGSLDSLIEDWHDFFGLPQGGRDRVAHNHLRMHYQRDAVDTVNINSNASGLGDVQLFASYQLSASERLSLVLKLPSPNATGAISNDSLEVGLIYFSHAELSPGFGHFGSAAISTLANDGLFKDQLRSLLFTAQYGVDYRLHQNYHLIVQSDYHSPLLMDSALDAFNHSLQLQFVLRVERLMPQHDLDIFFSEDIFPGHAPDITFALRLSSGY